MSHMQRHVVVIVRRYVSWRLHLSYDVCLEVRAEIIRTVLCMVLCTEAVHSH